MKLFRVTMLGIFVLVAAVGAILIAATGTGAGNQRHIGHVGIYSYGLTSVEVSAQLQLPLPSVPVLPDLDGLPTCC